ncbi:MAG: GFA family protein [Rhodobacter sp.]|nr:GFA family protein [Rhodobacter sp.]
MVHSLTGGCRCGRIRYAFSEPPTFRYICCCRDCQRFTGSIGMPNIGGPRRSFRLLDGRPAHYAVTADNGATIHRGFCGACGSCLFVWPEIDGVLYTAQDDVVGVAAGTLDDPALFVPEFAVYTDRAPPWAAFPEGLPRYPAP